MKFTRLMASSLLLTAMVAVSATASAYQFFVTIQGTKTGAFKGESVQKGEEAKIPGVAFSYSVRSPRDLATGLASGKRQHSPVSFTKAWGAASPQIFQALVNNEVLKSVLFEFTAPGAAGADQVYQTVLLTNASLSGLTRRASVSNTPNELEDISMTFQKIQIADTIGGVLAEDDWSAAVQ